jgi:hypothetical protein
MKKPDNRMPKPDQVKIRKPGTPKPRRPIFTRTVKQLSEL